MNDNTLYPPRTPPGAPAIDPQTARRLSVWLALFAAAVFLMALIGAITRLTESGLSMVEWKPLIGVLPPLSDTEWARVFGLYQESPEYRVMHAGMDLAEFKNIFFWEWLHRTWGHLIGAAFLLPFLYFFFTRQIPKTLLPRLLFIFALGGLQGFIGWYMVASGLVDRPSVSHYRLALHLGMAFLIYAATLWTIFMLRVPRPTIAPVKLRKLGWMLLPLPLLTMVWGAFTAGLKAGYAYNTFPLMNGTLVPAEAWSLSPFWLNLLANSAAVQFTHRWLAIATAFAIFAFAARLERTDRKVAIWLGAAVLVQVLLGISTLLTGVNIALAAAHQAGALTVLSLFLLALYRLGKEKRPLG